MKIPVIFAVNNEYVKILSVVLLSILNSSNSSEYEFFILNKDITSDNKDKLYRTVQEYKGSSLTFTDMNDVIKDLNIEKYMNIRENYNYISIESYFRIFISELFSQYDKVIYLDSDITVFNDLESLFNINIENYYAAAVQDKYMDTVLKKNPEHYTDEQYATFEDYIKYKLKKSDNNYFNSGVLLLNLKKMRNDNIFTKSMDFLQKNHPLCFWDQDVLNAVFEDKVKFIDEKYNFQNKTCAIPKETVILHYTGPDKPWNKFDESEIFQCFWKYAKHSRFWENDLKNLYSNYKADSFRIKIFSFTPFKIISCKTYIRIKLLFFSFKIKRTK